MKQLRRSAWNAGPAIHHYDLYRLTEPHDLARLDLQASFREAVSLVEWPERLSPAQLPLASLSIELRVLEAAEQQQLQALGHILPSASGEEDEEWGGDGSGDERWRRIALSSASPRWQERLRLLQAYLETQGPQFGCWEERWQCRQGV